MVELALEKWGAPIFVRHEIVHNKYVVEKLRAKGAIFVEDLADCPTNRPVIFSAHGVPKSVEKEANNRNMIYVDATCPLVSKVHNEAERHFSKGRQMIMIGHKDHPETLGTMGQLPLGEVLLVENIDDVQRIKPRDKSNLAFITQTTLSIDDTSDIIAALKSRFPNIVGPSKEDICYATTNRQSAVKEIATKTKNLLVIGAPNSSNSNRLVEVGLKAGCAYSSLVERASEIDWALYKNISSIGLTAGASAPDNLVDEVIEAFNERFDTTLELVETAVENIEFKVPKILRDLP
jgi:4-hydroxy-3-methylbut-2-enyl diphosphate reductase